MRTTLSLLTVAAIALVAPHAQAEAPPILPVQGTLYDAFGEPIHDALPVEFTLYSDPDGRAPLWSDVMTVDFVDGTFAAYLGEGDPINHVIFRDYDQVFVGIAIDGDEEMPLFALATAPYAGYAAYCGDASSLNGLSADDIAANALIDARAEFAPLGHRTPWSTVDGIPAGFADGIDNDTTLSEAEVDAFVADNRFAWSSLDGIPAGFADGIDNDTDTTLSEAQVDAFVSNNGYITGVGVTVGLTGGGTDGDVTLSPDPTWLQRRVGTGCPTGSAIQAINEDGSVVCVPLARIACNRTGSVFGDQGCNDDITITCVGGFVTEIRFSC